MNASQFVDLLEKHGLLDQSIVDELRKQVSNSRVKMTPESIAKLLVDNGQLTRFQATRLISESSLGASVSSEQATSESKPKSDSEDDLIRGVDPLAKGNDDRNPRDESKWKTGKAKVVIEDEDDMLDVEVVDVVDVEEAEEVIEIPKRGSSRTEAISADSFGDVSRIKPITVKAVPKKNPWDSFRILGVGGILLLLLVPLGLLSWWLWRQNAAEGFNRANSAYETKDYSEAIKKYEQFSRSFPMDENASVARVRVALSKIRFELEKVGDPLRAHETAATLLPGIESEKALGSERSDLAGAMLGIAEKFNQKAMSAKETAEKKGLMTAQEAHLKLCENPAYIDSTTRKSSENTILRIGEDRARILKDIERADDLAKAILDIRAALEAKDVAQSYSLRRTLLRKHIQLESEPSLQELLDEGRMLLKSQVSSDASRFQPVDEQKDLIAKETLLANIKSEGAEKPDEGLLVVRAKGSIWGLSAASGAVRWRKYFGEELEKDPKPVNFDPDSDVVVTLPIQGELRRIHSTTGETVWRIRLGQYIFEPTIDREDMFVTSSDGSVYCLDLETGATRWAKKLPQKCSTGVGLATGKNSIYVVGNHSNIFVMNRKDGECREVAYLGHQDGAVLVPPVVLLGHVFVFENSGPGVSRVNIFNLKEDGTGLAVAQVPIRLEKGHVVIPPQAEGRRLAVVTDLGEIAILDVEPSKEQNKVSRIISQVGTSKEPKRIWPLLDKNDLWVVGGNLTRFQLLISKQQLEQKWIREDQDQFVTGPKKYGKYLICSRVVRGTKGVRVSAVEGTEGNPVWEVDLGTPIQSISVSPSGFPLLAISSQAALFTVDESSLGSGSGLAQLENVGRSERSIMLGAPNRLADGRQVLLNEESGNQLMVVDPSKRTAGASKRVLLSLGNARSLPFTLPIGLALVLPLDNGQITAVDPSTGSQASSPYQPTMKPGVPHVWLGGVVTSDPKVVAMVDNSQQIHRLSIGKTISSLTSKTMSRTLNGRICLVGSSLVAVGRGAVGDSLEVISDANLETVQVVELQGTVVWGPYAVGEIALVQTSADGLVALDSAGNRRWQCPLADGTLVGQPIADAESLIVADNRGHVRKVQMMDGSIAGEIDIGQPLSAGPLLIGEQLVLPGSEGVLYSLSTTQLLEKGKE